MFDIGIIAKICLKFLFENTRMMIYTVVTNQVANNLAFPRKHYLVYFEVPYLLYVYVGQQICGGAC